MTWVSLVVEDFKEHKDLVKVRWISKFDGVFDKDIIVEKGKSFHIEVED